MMVRVIGFRMMGTRSRHTAGGCRAAGRSGACAAARQQAQAQAQSKKQREHTFHRFSHPFKIKDPLWPSVPPRLTSTCCQNGHQQAQAQAQSKKQREHTFHRFSHPFKIKDPLWPSVPPRLTSTCCQNGHQSGHSLQRVSLRTRSPCPDESAARKCHSRPLPPQRSPRIFPGHLP